MIKVFTCQIHAVPGTGYQAYIANCIQCAKFIKWQAFVHEMNWHELDGSETTVNASHELVHGGPQVLVFFDVLSRRHG
jgi:hypothetical protein